MYWGLFSESYDITNITIIGEDERSILVEVEIATHFPESEDNDGVDNDGGNNANWQDEVCESSHAS